AFEKGPVGIQSVYASVLYFSRQYPRTLPRVSPSRIPVSEISTTRLPGSIGPASNTISRFRRSKSSWPMIRSAQIRGFRCCFPARPWTSEIGEPRTNCLYGSPSLPLCGTARAAEELAGTVSLATRSRREVSTVSVTVCLWRVNLLVPTSVVANDQLPPLV